LSFKAQGTATTLLLTPGFQISVMALATLWAPSVIRKQRRPGWKKLAFTFLEAYRSTLVSF